MLLFVAWKEKFEIEEKLKRQKYLALWFELYSIMLKYIE